MVDPDEQRARERVGQVVGGHWKLERLLGVGGMAAVYAAKSDYGSEAALKILHPAFSQREDVRERFVQEGELAKHLDHEGVVRVRGIYADPGTEPYLVMELLHGETLTDRIGREEAFGSEEVLRVMDQVLDVLVEAHDKGVVHRDLKPDNIFLTEDGGVKVLDFGIARRSGANQKHRTKAGIALGTVPYMAPEQALGKRDQIDARTDLFALGAMAFRILSGRNVHLADTDAELLIEMASKPAPPLRTVAPRVSPALAGVIDMALAFSQGSRYPDASTMQADVRAVIAGRAAPLAGRAVAAREASTRVDLAAPVVPPNSLVSSAADATRDPGLSDELDWPDSHRAPAAAVAAPVRVVVERTQISPTGATAAAPHEKRSGAVWLLAILAVLGVAAASYALGRGEAEAERSLPEAMPATQEGTPPSGGRGTTPQGEPGARAAPAPKGTPRPVVAPAPQPLPAAAPVAPVVAPAPAPPPAPAPSPPKPSSPGNGGGKARAKGTKRFGF